MANITGTNASEILPPGTDALDTIQGLGGSDQINGLGGYGFTSLVVRF